MDKFPLFFYLYLYPNLTFYLQKRKGVGFGDLWVAKPELSLSRAGVELGHYSRQANVLVNLELGKSYELIAKLNPNNTSGNGPLEPIEFTVGNIDNWVEENTNNNNSMTFTNNGNAW